MHQAYFKCSVTTSGQWLPYWTAQTVFHDHRKFCQTVLVQGALLTVPSIHMGSMLWVLFVCFKLNQISKSVVCREEHSQLLRDLFCFRLLQMSDQQTMHIKSSLIAVFENRVLLEHSHPHSFMYYVHLLLQRVVELSGCDRDHMACKARNTYCLSLFRKCLPTPGLSTCVPL